MEEAKSPFPFDYYELRVIDGATLFHRFYMWKLEDNRTSTHRPFLPPYARTILDDVAGTFALNPLADNSMLARVLKTSPVGTRPTLFIDSQISTRGNLSVIFDGGIIKNENEYCQFSSFSRPRNEIMFIHHVDHLDWTALNDTNQKCDLLRKATLGNELTIMIVVAFRSLMLKLLERFDVQFRSTPEPDFSEKTLEIVGLVIMDPEEAIAHAAKYQAEIMLDYDIRQKYEALVAIEKRGLGAGMKKPAMSALNAAGIRTDYTNLAKTVEQLRNAFDRKFPDWRTTPPPDDQPPQRRSLKRM